MALRGKPDFHHLKTLQHIGWRFKKQYCSVKRLNEAKKVFILTWISEYGTDRCLSDKELQSAFKVIRELKVKTRNNIHLLYSTADLKGMRMP